MAKPSVLFINRVYPPVRGASGRILHDLARSFAADGWSVTVLTTGEKTVQTMEEGVLVRRIKAPLRMKGALSYTGVWLRLFFAALRLARRDLVVSLTDPPLLIVLGRLYAKLKGSRHIHWCQDLYPDLFSAMGVKLPAFLVSLMHRLSRRSMKSCDGIVVIGRCMAKRIEALGVEASRLSVIPNWADFELYMEGQRSAPPQGPKKNLRRDENRKFRVLYAGNLGRMHPVKPVLEAASLLSDHPEIEFVFAGMGPRYEILARERERMGLANIKLLPWQPLENLRALMESADVHLVSMRSQSAGMLVPCKFYSALAVQRPVVYIGPEDTEIAAVIKSFGVGMSVPPGKGAELAQAIIKYRNDGEEWFRAQECAAGAGEVFSPEASICTWLKRAEDVVAL